MMSSNSSVERQIRDRGVSHADTRTAAAPIDFDNTVVLSINRTFDAARTLKDSESPASICIQATETAGDHLDDEVLGYKASQALVDIDEFVNKMSQDCPGRGANSIAAPAGSSALRDQWSVWDGKLEEGVKNRLATLDLERGVKSRLATLNYSKIQSDVGIFYPNGSVVPGFGDAELKTLSMEDVAHTVRCVQGDEAIRERIEKREERKAVREMEEMDEEARLDEEYDTGTRMDA